MSFLQAHYDKLALAFAMVALLAFWFMGDLFPTSENSSNNNQSTSSSSVANAPATQRAASFIVDISDWEKELRTTIRDKYDSNDNDQLEENEEEGISAEDRAEMDDAGFYSDVHYNVPLVEIETRNPHGLMPGDRIELVENIDDPDEHGNGYLVKEIVLPDEYERISIKQLNGKMIEGDFVKSNGPFILGAKLEELALTIEVDGSQMKIPGNDVQHLNGSRRFRVIVDQNASIEHDPGSVSLITYQKRHYEESEKADVVWDNPSKSTPPYDLFTPPRIYMIKGRLLAKLPKRPEVVKPKEPFGLQLVAFKKKPYHFNLKSWGADPLLFDERTKRNQIVKVNLCYKQGKHQLEETTEQDAGKVIKILSFKEDLQKDPKTGGTRRMGTLSLLDYNLKRKVTITNLEPSNAGQFSVEIRSTLLGEETKEFSDIAAGFLFHLGGKEYRILEIDPDNRVLKVEKISNNPEDTERQTLRLGTSPALEQ